MPPAKTRTEPEKKTGSRSDASYLPLYSVILHNDDVTPMDVVITALIKSVPQLSEQEAVEIMFEAHETGRAIVIVCPLEPAELYMDRIRSFTIGCTIERA